MRFENPARPGSATSTGASALPARVVAASLASLLLWVGLPGISRGEDGKPAADRGAPSLAMSASRWDLGKISAGRYQQAFEITNTGAGALRIDEVRVSDPSRMNATVMPMGTEVGRHF